MKSRLKILIVEDEGIIAAGLESCVKNMGYTVASVAFTGVEAIRFLNESSVDLILMDINLPDMTGIDVLKMISQKAEIPCIFITGYSDKKLILDAKGISNTYGYLIKPIDENELGAAIEIALSRNTERIELKDFASDAQKALEERKQVERAKGLLMDNFGMKESEAMKYLQKRSKDNNKKITAVAREVIAFLGGKM